jgi:hypothetical protein
MDPNNVPRLGKSAFLILPIIALALYIAFIPKLDYPYPVHIDEWVHIAHTNSLLQDGNVKYPDPFVGGSGDPATSLESGFHALFAIFYEISGLSWIDIVRYLPSIIFAFTVLSVYILARREGFGWEAAFFTCLLPTTVGILGPAFFLPLSLCLPFVPLSLFLVFNYRTPWSYLALFIFFCFMIITHAASAVCFILIMIPCVLFYLIKEPKHGLILLLMGVVPLLVTLPWTYVPIATTFESLLVQQPLPTSHDLPRIIITFGYLPAALGLLGALWLAIKGGVKNYSLVLGLLLIAAMLAVFYTLHYGIELVYFRGIFYMLLIFGITAGASLNMIKKIKLPKLFRLPQFARKIGYLFCLAIVVVVLVIAIPVHQQTNYYHMITEEDYQAFVWIRDNVGVEYLRAILDPWKATAFTAITGKYIYARIHMGPTDITRSADKFLADKCVDTDLLIQNGITLVYTQGECDNPALTKIRDNIYVLKK